VRSIYAAWERGDFSSAEWAHPEIEFVLADGPDPAVSTGVAGMAGAWRDRVRAWEDARLVVENYRELDDGRVLVPHHGSGRGKISGLDVGQLGTPGAILFHVRDGRVTRLALYDRAHALADLGLASEGRSPDS
jgi:ketosteroid isomerase-like protein